MATTEKLDTTYECVVIEHQMSERILTDFNLNSILNT